MSDIVNDDINDADFEPSLDVSMLPKVTSPTSALAPKKVILKLINYRNFVNSSS